MQSASYITNLNEVGNQIPEQVNETHRRFRISNLLSIYWDEEEGVADVTLAAVT
jgi:hypothetical protein